MRPFAAASALVLATACAAVGTSVTEVGSAAIGNGAGAAFELRHAKVRPARALFDGKRRVVARYSFNATRPLDIVVRVVRRGDRRVVRRWVERDLEPRVPHRRRWDGRRRDRGIPADGRYEFRIGPRGHRGTRTGTFRFHDHTFPVDGPHRYGDRFGEPRSGGRVHEGQDLPAPCGTPISAARGGRVQARGYSDALYGYWVLIDGRATRHDHFYSHLVSPTPLADGERVRTGERVGSVGKTGNARSEFCQLHFELWPRGYRNGPPRDPLPALRRWDSHS